MGRVYVARDRRLGRTVAIKVLAPGTTPTPQAFARLRREAEAASSLNHPAIVTIYDIGETPEAGFFVAMELIDGVNLREWLQASRSPHEKIDVLLQVAAGLAAAHGRGLVHRDIKPENIMITRDGFAKVVDFGLAKSVESKPADDGSTDLRITGQGHIVGTLAYMSPEQLRGDPLDARSDIFSFGCVLYEAFGGKPPFGRDLGDPAEMPAALTHIVEYCLKTDRAARYQSMQQLAADLRAAEQPPSRMSLARWAGIAAGVVVVAGVWVIAARMRMTAFVPVALPPTSIAVMPFRAVGPAEQAYIADGISDALTTDLARQSNLTVIARNSTQRYKMEDDLRRTADQLRVRYLLLGSVTQLAQNVRIDARLVDATTSAHVWADHYERPLSDVFSAEEAIVRAISAKLTPTATPPRVAQPADPRVADLYLRARFFAEDREWPTRDRSIPLLEQVVQLDPNFLPARIHLAAQYQRKAFQPDPERKWEEKAFVELQKILVQNPAAAEAYAIRANLHWNLAHGFAHERSLADLDHALRLDPNSVTALDSRGSILMHVGFLDEALADFHKALRLDPFNDFATYRVARIHLYQQKCGQAAAEFKKNWPHAFELPIALDCAGASDEAVTVLSRLRQEPGAGNESDRASSAAVIYARRGRRQDAEQAIRTAIAKDTGGSHYHHAMYNIARAYAQLGNVDSAVHWLERTSREGMPCYPLFASDYLLDPIRSDPRIEAFLDASRREWEQRRRERRAS